MREHLWAVVLAGGEGRRIRHLTTDASGRSVPKQYASLDGDESMLRKTLNRAERIVPRERMAVVVARQHRDYWGQELADMPRGNVIVQPRNRGTGTGLLLGVLHLRLRDPRCEVLVLPSDHHVGDEEALRGCLLRAVEHARAGGQPTLVGVSPERDGGELGWIVAGDGASSSVREVVGFVEKPEPSVVRRLISQGALVNSMILAADADALLGLFQDAVASAVDALGAFLAASEQSPDGLDALYETLPTCDFSRDVLERAAERLAVVATPPCGWTDIGTPARLGRVLRQAADSASPVASGGGKIRGRERNLPQVIPSLAADRRNGGSRAAGQGPRATLGRKSRSGPCPANVRRQAETGPAEARVQSVRVGDANARPGGSAPWP